MKQNYRSGRALEWTYRKKLEADGFTVMRSVGSKGPFDFVAWDRTIVLFVQLKRRMTCPAAGRMSVGFDDDVPPGSLARVVHLDKEGGFCEH